MDLDCLHQYRISKHPKDIYTGVSSDDQWTSLSDVGKIFCGKALTYSEYIYTENQYLEFIEWVCKTSGVERLRITNLEDYQGLSHYPNLSWTEGVEQVKAIARDCLREKYWCKLQSRNMFIHFGYDYYLYIGLQVDCTQIYHIASSLGLFVKKMPSPYCKLDSE